MLVQKFQVEIRITGVDMPSAFNSIKRTKLIKILKLPLQEDEVCIIRIPHSNATLAGSDLTKNLEIPNIMILEEVHHLHVLSMEG